MLKVLILFVTLYFKTVLKNSSNYLIQDISLTTPKNKRVLASLIMIISITWYIQNLLVKTSVN